MIYAVSTDVSRGSEFASHIKCVVDGEVVVTLGHLDDDTVALDFDNHGISVSDEAGDTSIRTVFAETTPTGRG